MCTLLGLVAATALAETISTGVDHAAQKSVEGMREHAEKLSLKTVEARPVSDAAEPQTSFVETGRVDLTKAEKKEGWQLMNYLFSVPRTPTQITCCCKQTECDDTDPTDSGQWWTDVKENADANDNRSCCKFLSGTACEADDGTGNTYSAQSGKYMCPLVVSPQQNFCRHLTDNTKTEVSDCTGAADCTNSYQRNPDGQNGTYRMCEVSGGFGGGCRSGSGDLFECPWTFYMNDMIENQQNEVGQCYSDMLEARRSLDGLLHAVNQTFAEMMVQNNVIAVENTTIRALLQQQQDDFTQYLDDQQTCMTVADNNKSTDLFNIEIELDELVAIARPDVRSAVNFDDYAGYQTEARADTCERCPDGNAQCNPKSYGEDGPCIVYTGVNDPPDGAIHCKLPGSSCPAGRTCWEDGGSTYYSLPANASCSSTPFRGYVASSLVETAASAKTKAKATSMVKRATSFLEAAADMEMGAEQCHKFTSLVSKVNTKFKMVLNEPDCHEERVALQRAFNASYLALAQLYDQKARQIETERAFCLSKAEYDYKEGVEGAGGIDEQIQAAAQRIHTAQHTIGVMEPRLHDLEHAVRTVRNYIESIKATCTIDDSVTDHLNNIRTLIEKITECPGLNDFTISIPHWSPARIATPSPTPWPIYGPLRGPRSFYLVPVSPNDVV